MSEYSCCGEYNDHSLFCSVYRLPKLEAQVTILKFELERYRRIASALGALCPIHLN